MKIRTVVRDLYLSARGAVFAVVASRPVTKLNASEVGSIAVLRTDRIGDVIVSLPTVEALKKLFPKSRLSVVVQPGICPLIRHLPYVDECVPYEGLLRTSRELRRRRFDIAVDLVADYTARSAILARMAGVRCTAGFDMGGRGRLFNIRIGLVNERRRMAEVVFDVARAFAAASGADELVPGEVVPRLTVPPGAASFADGYLAGMRARDPNAPAVIVHPGGYYESQRWPEERFALLGDLITRRYGAAIVLIASACEREIVERIAARMASAPARAVGLPLDHVAGLIGAGAVLVCNNSGPLHIAAALGTPSVSTMGPTDADLWWPIGKGHTVVRRRSVDEISVDDMSAAFDATMKDIVR